MRERERERERTNNSDAHHSLSSLDFRTTEHIRVCSEQEAYQDQMPTVQSGLLRSPVLQCSSGSINHVQLICVHVLNMARFWV